MKSPTASTVRSIPAMKASQKVQYFVLAIYIMLSAWFFWSWVVQPEYISDPVLFFLRLIPAFYVETFLPIAYLFFLGQMRRPVPVPVPKGLRVAAITLTVVGSESLEIVKQQLQALKSITYPHDSWILVDGCHSPKIKQMAQQMGICYFSRHDLSWGALQVKSWNRSYPPFKAKTKAGNVNAWLNAFGSAYDYFVQFDIDHRPVPAYLDKTLGYFQDPKVAWVQGPSVYGNLDLWTARGAAEQELALQGPLQGGLYGFAQTPFVIGSHTTYRMSAIKAIDGFQPTRAEDHLDTLCLAAKGYKGVYEPSVIAVGDGPEDFGTAMSQQFAWAYSMFQILRSYTPRLIWKLNWRQKFTFLFSETWYPLWSVSMLILFFLPILSLMVNSPIMNVGLGEYLIHVSPLDLGILIVFIWSWRWSEPKGLTLSWRGIILDIARWPVVISAVIQAAFNIKKPYMITVKGAARVKRPFSLSPHIPFLIFFAISIGTCWWYLVNVRYGVAQGYLLFAIGNALICLLVYALVIAKDIQEMTVSGVPKIRAFFARSLPLLSVIVFLGLTTTTARFSAEQIVEAVTYNPNLLVQGKPVDTIPVIELSPQFVAQEATFATATSTPVPAPLPLSKKTVVVETPERKELSKLQLPKPTPVSKFVNLPNRVFFGVYDPPGPTRFNIDVEEDFIDWKDAQAVGRIMTLAQQNGHVSLITVEPNTTASGFPTQILADTIGGGNDAVVTALAKAVKAREPQTVLIRWAQEMELVKLADNGTGQLIRNYPWSTPDPQLYIKAYRHVHDIFGKVGVTNVKWVFSPAGNFGSEKYYPGDTYVDYIGLTLLEHAAWDTAVGLPPRTFRQLLDEKYPIAQKIPNKPIIIAELGVSGADDYRKTWLAAAVNALHDYPHVAGVVYFNSTNATNNWLPNEPDWRISPNWFPPKEGR